MKSRKATECGRGLGALGCASQQLQSCASVGLIVRGLGLIAIPGAPLDCTSVAAADPWGSPSSAQGRRRKFGPASHHDCGLLSTCRDHWCRSRAVDALDLPVVTQNISLIILLARQQGSPPNPQSLMARFARFLPACTAVAPLRGEAPGSCTHALAGAGADGLAFRLDRFWRPPHGQAAAPAPQESRTPGRGSGEQARQRSGEGQSRRQPVRTCGRAALPLGRCR
jgi:hypothetical protein